MPYFTLTFRALLREAEFTKQMLASGATQIRAANYATKGVYFQAFTSLSTGIERIGKLCLLVDYHIEKGGAFPDSNYLKNQIGHKIELLYEKAQAIIAKRSIELRLAKDLSDPIHKTILNILHNFAEGDRYSNINLLVGSGRSDDPIARWFEEVDLALFEARVTQRKKDAIAQKAAMIALAPNPSS